MIRSPRVHRLLVLALLAPPLVAQGCRTASSASQSAAPPTARVASSGYLTGTDALTVVEVDRPAYVALVGEFDGGSALLHTSWLRVAGRQQLTRRAVPRTPAKNRHGWRRCGPQTEASQRAERNDCLGPDLETTVGRGSGRGAKALVLIASSTPLSVERIERALEATARDAPDGAVADSFVAKLGQFLEPGSFTTHVLRSSPPDSSRR